MYPTASKLVAALMFSGLAFWISGLVIANLPDGMRVGLFGPVNAVIGLCIGWRVMGQRAGNGPIVAAGAGLTASAAIVFWAVLIWAVHDMVRRSMRFYNDGATDLFEAFMALGLSYASYLNDGGVLSSLLAGAVFCALVTEWVARRE